MHRAKGSVRCTTHRSRMVGVPVRWVTFLLTHRWCVKIRNPPSGRPIVKTYSAPLAPSLLRGMSFHARTGTLHTSQPLRLPRPTARAPLRCTVLRAPGAPRSSTPRMVWPVPNRAWQCKRVSGRTRTPRSPPRFHPRAWVRRHHRDDESLRRLASPNRCHLRQVASR